MCGGGSPSHSWPAGDASFARTALAMSGHLSRVHMHMLVITLCEKRRGRTRGVGLVWGWGRRPASAFHCVTVCRCPVAARLSPTIDSLVAAMLNAETETETAHRQGLSNLALQLSSSQQ